MPGEDGDGGDGDIAPWGTSSLGERDRREVDEREEPSGECEDDDERCAMFG